MVESILTSKGQTTLPKAVREALGVVPGDRVRYVIMGRDVRILPVRPIGRLFGALKHEGPPVGLSDMERGIEAGASGT
jgi:AbrB family looped-hinge helix DNA binding protein